MIVYLTIFPNGKLYVGQDARNNKNYFGSGTICKNAIKKYGFKKLKKLILFKGYNQEQLNLMEKYFIKFFHTTNKNIGYNITKGYTGKYNKQSKIDEHKKKISIARKTLYENGLAKNSFYQKGYTKVKVSEQTKMKLRLCNLGKKFSKETCEKKSKTMKKLYKKGLMKSQYQKGFVEFYNNKNNCYKNVA